MTWTQHKWRIRAFKMGLLWPSCDPAVIRWVSYMVRQCPPSVCVHALIKLSVKAAQTLFSKGTPHIVVSDWESQLPAAARSGAFTGFFANRGVRICSDTVWNWWLTVWQSCSCWWMWTCSRGAVLQGFDVVRVAVARSVFDGIWQGEHNSVAICQLQVRW